MKDEVWLHSVKAPIPGHPKCPKCQRRVDGATGLSLTEPYPEPEPGNLAVCVYCGALNRYDEKLRLLPVSREERRKLLRRDEKLRRLVKIVELAATGVRRQWQ